MARSTRTWLPFAALLASLVTMVFAPAPAAAAPPSVEIPPELEPWIEWVKVQKPEPGDCREVSGVTICLWPSYLSVNASETGAEFEIDVSVFGPGRVVIPGSHENWPQSVRVDNKPGLVSRVGDEPSLDLEPGRHKITGSIPWQSIPDSLRVPTTMGLIDLRVQGEAIAFPSRNNGWLTLERPGADEVEEPEVPEEPEAPDVVEPDSETIEVSRQLVDGVPLQVLTRIDLHVTGTKRELVLPKPMWDDAKVLQVSAPVPVKMGDDGTLVLQVRPGSFTVEVRGLLARAPTELKPPKRPAPWPADEVWVWQAAQPNMPSMGQVSLSGAQAVDRKRTHAPADWQGGATYKVTADTPLKFEIIQRGVSETAPNELQLRREMRVDVGGTGWSVIDRVNGTMNRGTRLDLVGGALATAMINGELQVVTVGEAGHAGVEVRSPSLSMEAGWRIEGATTTLPLGAWSEGFDRVELEFRLPRGWDLLRSTGPGTLKPTWFGAWRPLDLILLFVVVLLVGRFVHPLAAVAALLGLGLGYTRNGDGYVMLLGLVALLALLPVPLERVRHKWAQRGLRIVWASAAFMVAAWVIWRVPQGVAAVWRDGLSGLAHVALERDFEDLAQVWSVVAAFCGGALGLAWLTAHANKGSGRWVALGLTAIVGLGGLGYVFNQLEGGSDMMATDSRSNADVDFEGLGRDQAAFAEAPADEVYEEESEDGYRHKGEEGKMGNKPAKKSDSGLYAMKGPKDAVPEMAKEFDAEEAARNSGILGVMEQQDGQFLADPSANGAFGVGGLALEGTGRGGGGDGDGTIGLGNTGLIGRGGGSGSGYGTGAGLGGKGKRVARVRQAKATVQGALDNDIIRRIVRAHINEVRACYEQGLANNPELEGRVEVNFVITGTGKVGSAVNTSTLGENSVGNCIASAVKRWKFPKPQGGGNVVVTYPFTLSPGDGPAGAPAAERFVATDVQLDKLPPPAVPQTGEGMPDWSGPSWSMTLDRAVKADESIGLWLVTPTMSKAIALLRALALIWLAIALLRRGWFARLAPDDAESKQGPAQLPGGGAGKAAAAATVAALVFAFASTAHAAPPNDLLEQLRQRVNADAPLAPTPDCGAQCALVSKLKVDVRGDTLEIRAEVHMAGPGVWVLPGSIDSWIPKSVKVDGKAAPAMAVHNNQIVLHLAKGLHGVELSGPVGSDTLDLSLPTLPKFVGASADGWIVTGIDENDLAQSLHFQRQASDATDPGDPADPEGPDGPDGPDGSGDPVAARTAQDQAPWFAVERNLVIGPRWTVKTRVTRLSHGPSPTKVRVPLLPGEKMLEASAKVDDPKASLTLNSPGHSITWTSVLEQSAALELRAPADQPWAETWIVTCAGAWQCGEAGTPPTQDAGGTKVFHPWPGESLALSFFEPKPAAGQLVAIDRANLNIALGETGTEAALTMAIRSATVAEQTVTLPPEAHIGKVRIDGNDVPVAKDSSEVRLTFQPGAHQVDVQFKLDSGAAAVVKGPVVQLGGRAVNTRVTFSFSDADERVIVWTSGEGAGPIVWLWPYLAFLALLAMLLARFTAPPLNVLQWFLLSLGFSVLALPIVLGWFVLVELRERHAGRLDSALRYNAAQIGLAVITLGVLGIVLMTGKQLLTSPASTIVHNWSDGAQLSWYLDRSESATPGATIVTLSTSLWRALWAVWVIWLGWSAIAWSKWSWGIVAEGKWLRSQPAPDPAELFAAATPAPAPTPAHEAAPGSAPAAETPAETPAIDEPET